MNYQPIEKEIIKATKEFAESNNIHYDEVTESMILNAMRELNKRFMPFVVSSGNQKPKHKGKWKCKLCGRDTFDTKTPHKCVSGYTKRGLIWEEIE